MHDTLLENFFASNWVVYTIVTKLTGTIWQKIQEDYNVKSLWLLVIFSCDVSYGPFLLRPLTQLSTLVQNPLAVLKTGYLVC